MKPRSTRLRAADLRRSGGAARIDHGFLSDDGDVESIVNGLERLRRFVADDPIAGWIARAPPRQRRPARLRPRGRPRLLPSVATCALGRVVDADARVLGYDNLYVADASIMPTIPRANTNLSTAAVAERVADLLRG